MNAAWLLALQLLVAAWAGALIVAVFVLARLMRVPGRDEAWPSIREVAPALDLVGMWLGTAATVALTFGRTGYSNGWAACLGMVAVMITAGLYDRAVLMPSLEAAWKRLVAAAPADQPKWIDEWRFLWRMAVVARAGSLVLACATLWLSLGL